MPGSDFELRVARIHDLDATYDLFAEVQSIHADAEPEFFRQPEKDETFRQFFGRTINDPEKRIVLACFGGIPVGYILFFMGSRPRNIYQLERRFAYIHQLVVTKAFRRTGCATTLIDLVKNEARKKGTALLGIDFWSFNDAARTCFEKSGFKVNQEFMWLHL